MQSVPTSLISSQYFLPINLCNIYQYADYGVNDGANKIQHH